MSILYEKSYLRDVGQILFFFPSLSDLRAGLCNIISILMSGHRTGQWKILLISTIKIMTQTTINFPLGQTVQL